MGRNEEKIQWFCVFTATLDLAVERTDCLGVSLSKAVEETWGYEYAEGVGQGIYLGSANLGTIDDYRDCYGEDGDELRDDVALAKLKRAAIVRDRWMKEAERNLRKRLDGGWPVHVRHDDDNFHRYYSMYRAAGS